MVNYEIKYQDGTIPNISEVSTIQETIDVKIDNIKEKNIKIESINLKTQSINNLISSGIPKKNCSKLCKILCFIICLISLLCIITSFIIILYSPCRIQNERPKLSVRNSYVTNNTKEFDNND